MKTLIVVAAVAACCGVAMGATCDFKTPTAGCKGILGPQATISFVNASSTVAAPSGVMLFGKSATLANVTANISGAGVCFGMNTLGSTSQSSGSITNNSTTLSFRYQFVTSNSTTEEGGGGYCKALPKGQQYCPTNQC